MKQELETVTAVTSCQPLAKLLPSLVGLNAYSKITELFLEGQDIRPNSLTLYRRNLTSFFKWLDANGMNLGSVCNQQIQAYRDSLLAEGKSVATVNCYLTTVRRLFAWLEASSKGEITDVARIVKGAKRDMYFKKLPLDSIEQAGSFLDYYRDSRPSLDLENAIYRKSNGKQRKRPIEEKEVEALRDYYQTKAKRDLAITSLIIHTCLRTIEASRANIGDLQDLGEKEVLYIQGKGRAEKDRFVVIGPKTKEALSAYLETRGAYLPSDPLFISTSRNSKGQRLTTRTISGIAKEGLKAIGKDSKYYTAHSLRHTGACLALEAGASLVQVQQMLGHASIDTTRLYTKTLERKERLKNPAEDLLDSLF